MRPGKTLQRKFSEDFDKYIVYSSNFDHYSKSLLAFLRKSVGATTVFFAFHDREKSLEQNPIFYGKKLSRQIERTIGTTIATNPMDCSRLARKCNLAVKLSVGGATLGLAGALFSQRTGPSMSLATKSRFRYLCERLKKDFYFIREQVVQKRKLADLDALYQISKDVSDTLNLDKLLASITQAAKKLTKAQACSLAVADPLNQELTFTVAKGPAERMILNRRMQFGQGIVGNVVETGKPLLIADTRKDKRFFSGMDKLTGFTTRSILCVPMKVRNNVIGAIEVLNPMDRASFSQDQIPTLLTLAQEAAVSIENARLFHLATTDGLTGLATIRYFKTLLEYEMTRSERYGRPLSLMMLDIDFFKKVNDSHGHVAGDAILREVANLIRKSIRQADIPARYGGEEFIVMLPESGQKDAIAVAQRLRKTVQCAKIVHAGRSYAITISLGVATMTKGDQPGSLIERVDRNLYQAKQTGRNKVCIEQ